MSKEDRLKILQNSRTRTIRLIQKVEPRMSEQKDNEEAWPGHSNTRYHDDLNDYQVLKAHLKEIEDEIAKLKRA